jgi:hypothetical protein
MCIDEYRQLSVAYLDGSRKEATGKHQLGESGERTSNLVSVSRAHY